MDTSYLVKEAYQNRGEDTGKFYSRNLAILDFNQRVLALTEDPSSWKTSAKKVIYLDIVYRNIIEFIQVRLPRCNQMQKEECLKYMQEIFDEMGRLSDIADLENQSEVHPVMSQEIKYALSKEMTMTTPPLGVFYAGTVYRSPFDLYRYNGETDSEMLKEFIWLSSQDKIHIQQEPVVSIAVASKDTKFESTLPVLYLSLSTAYALTWYRTSTMLSGLAQKQLDEDRKIFHWEDEFDQIFKEHTEILMPRTISTPVRENRDLTESYPNTVVGAIEYMCELDSVYLICMTLYRAAKRSRIVDALIKAAMMGKKVMVYVEVMARGNEIANVAIINRLREAGVSVYHSFGGLKIHAKMFGAFIHGSEPDFAILSTGNFNEDSAESYTDMQYFTRERIYTQAIFDLFLHSLSAHDISNVVGKGPFGSHYIRTEIMRMIYRETGYGRKGRIWIKCNSLCDRSIIKALYAAVEAGVDIRILVRTGVGIGDTSTLPVHSKVGEFLEHERIYIFGDDIYLSSADLMVRNLDRRVESFFKIQCINGESRKILSNFLLDISSSTTREIHWDERVKALIMDSDPEDLDYE